ncbi:MAG: peptidylprolyl isomerase, partial [Pyrinomonadaceae bacterium MAG19_C2-C3]|nr:peptidylprolyl isomerase [Pyrinomonadaceae bacterium MAG19_C2-C3]
LSFASGLMLMMTVCFMLVDTTRAQPRARRAAAVSSSTNPVRVDGETSVRILRLEDERRWDASLAALLKSRNSVVRRRAALAAGRIGDREAVAPLAAMLESDAVEAVRAMAAFALGECEAVVDQAATQTLIAAVARERAPSVRARAVEALGKIAAALPDKESERKRSIGASVLYALEIEGRRPTSSSPRARTRATANRDVSVTLAALTAALRARPVGASPVLQNFLASPNADVRASAANTIARLRLKDANEKLRLVLNDSDPVVRANVARALGAAEDTQSFDALQVRATSDPDQRVRVSAIRALASLKDARAVATLTGYAEKLYATQEPMEAGATKNEMLEIVAALGVLLTNTENEAALNIVRRFREAEAMEAPEIEIALARMSPARYVRDPATMRVVGMTNNNAAATAPSWRAVSSVAQGLGEFAMLTEVGGNALFSVRADALIALRRLIDDARTPVLALPDAMRALAALKPDDLSGTLRRGLQHQDAFVRATAAELLAQTPPGDGIDRTLIAALPIALRDVSQNGINDAALAILTTLARRATPETNARTEAALTTALASGDHLVRRRAAALLDTIANTPNAANAENNRPAIGIVATRNTDADYRRALARRNGRTLAIVESDRGGWTMELLPEDAPLTVDNFIKLASSGFFNNLVIHRVVPNFVMQDGDPRGDGNGSPPYQIRCEINTVPYMRGAIGMALSGKDTGGSQWFATHAPQPHLDGGYTVFARVVEGMENVDRIARGDRIKSIRIVESASRAPRPTTNSATPRIPSRPTRRSVRGN